jgi:type II secretory pathway pseudopilin PulG
VKNDQDIVTRTAPVRPRPSEEGYILVAVIFMLAILILSMAVAVPRVREDIQRDREVETMHRGLQYARAVKLYYKKFHAYPPNIDALVKTNDIRFLRKRYTDPMTGKDDWKPIMFGQNKTPAVMGFFGQALAGSALAGTGGGPVNGASAIGSSFMSGNSSATGSALSNGSSPTGGNSIFGSNGTTGITGTATGTATGTTGGNTGASGTDAASGTGLSSNQTFGGGGIIGFSPGSERESILIYKKKTHYNEWEFLYSPQQDQMMLQGGNAGAIGTPAGNLNGAGTGTTGFGGFGSSGGTTTTPTTPTMPTSPQQ